MSDIFKSEFLARRLARELHIVRHLRHPNVIQCFDMHKMAQQDKLFIVTDLMEADLSQILRSQQSMVH